jgi:hypothetical protein
MFPESGLILTVSGWENVLQGVVSTLAGGGGRGFRDGEGIYAAFNFPIGLSIDWGGNAIVTDLFNHRLRKVLMMKKTTLGWVVNGGRRHAELQGDLGLGFRV